MTAKGEIFWWSKNGKHAQSCLHQWDTTTARHELSLCCDYRFKGTKPFSTLFNDDDNNVSYKSNQRNYINAGKWILDQDFVSPLV